MHRANPNGTERPRHCASLLLGVLQLSWAWQSWQGHAPRALLRPQQRLLYLKWLLAGAAICYFAGLMLGPDPSVGYLFCAGVIAWHTLGLWVLIKRPDLLSRVADRMQQRLLCRTNQVVLASICSVVSVEGVLRVYAVVADDPLAESYVAKTHVLPPGREIRGRQVNTLGYWDKEFRVAPRPGIFRIAVLGDDVTLSGTAETNCLSQIERRVPGVEIYNFGIPQAGPREYAAQLAHDVARFEPDLVLTFFSVGNDLTEELPLPGWFDWRGLRMYQLGARSSTSGQPVETASSTQPLSQEAWLRRCAPHLRVCRTPIDEHMNGRWQLAAAHLETMVRFCRRQDVPLALVVVPSPFQVNPPLCDALRRQAGYEPGQIDLSLPQRRLAALAADQCVPLVDLLPYFQSSGEAPYERYQQELNEHGNRVAADVVGRWIEQHYRTQIASARHAAAP